MNKNRLGFSRLFMLASGALLAITSLAKIISAFGITGMLDKSDPILGVHFRTLLWLAGALELMAAYICFFSKQIITQVVMIAWLSTMFLTYRLGLLLIHYHSPCPCLGNLTDAIHISPQTADTAMKIGLAYLLVGSYGILFHQWWKNRNVEVGRSALGSKGKTRPA